MEQIQNWAPWLVAAGFLLGVILPTMIRILREYEVNQKLQDIIDRQTDPWGIKVTAVEVKDVLLPEGMRRAMARQAEVERERRAKVINAEGEFQAAEKLVQAARKISTQPVALQLRFLQTISEISSEKTTTIVMPLPMELLRPFLGATDDKTGSAPKPVGA